MAATPRSSTALSLAQLIARLKSDDWAERLHAALALGRMGREAATAVPDLVETSKDGDPYVRKGAILALGDIGADAAAAVPALGQVLRHDAEPSVRGRAAAVLGEIATEETVPLLEESYAAEGNEEVREKIALAMAEIEGRAAAA
jgi:HEAT repeat protein